MSSTWKMHPNGLWRIQHLTQNQFSYPGENLDGVDYFIWHYTANPGAGDENHYRYFESLRLQNSNDDKEDRYASAQLFADRDSATEIIPLNKMALHSGKRAMNKRSIGIELCIEKDGTFHPDTIARAIKIGAWLCKEYKRSPHLSFLRHYDVTKKNCPKPWVENPALWSKFKSDVSAEMSKNIIPQKVAEKPKVVEDYMIKKEDADKIIGLLKLEWGRRQIMKDIAGCNEIGRLADEIRLASGQRPQNQ